MDSDDDQILHVKDVESFSTLRLLIRKEKGKTVANVGKQKREKVLELEKEGHDVEYIHDITGLRRDTIQRILGLEVDSPSAAELVIAKLECLEESEEDIESGEFWKGWAEFWKQKYLEEHAKVIILEA